MCSAEEPWSAPTWTTSPHLRSPLHPLLDVSVPASDAEGLALARQLARRAYVPASGFHVGALLVTEAGVLVPGCNVEHPADWTRGLCAERVALATAQAYGAGRPARLYVTCPDADLDKVLSSPWRRVSAGNGRV